MGLNTFRKTWSDKLTKHETCSERVLNGLCSLHHLLVAFANDYPELVTNANVYTRGLVADPYSYNPLLSIFLFALITDVPMQTLLPILAQVCLMVSAFQMVRRFPLLAYSAVSPRERVERSWQAAAQLLRTNCARVRVLVDIARTRQDDVAAMLARYNETAGRPEQIFVHKFQEVFKHIMEIDNFGEWFHSYGLPRPSDEELAQMLEKAVKWAGDQGHYTRPPLITFHTHYAVPVTNPCLALAVVGNCAELGMWRLDGTQGVMHRAGGTGGDWWEATVALPPDQWFSWKLVVVDMLRGVIMRWEERINRVNDTGRTDHVMHVTWNCN
eukprot:TRINITY_DN8539_c0_g1_i2.p1 TRINITY_DN8539_c0_g1~~TRINITY_DN8539_c0_g1_i2.p1  ORF type:complete len:327 (-),score=65.25 TRINITY_DN8539_c0_g1_i2:144-1124(-)